MAFNRKIQLLVGEDDLGTDISELDMSFQGSRSITFSENKAKFTIYNASEKTRKEILKKDNNLVFNAGYEDEGTATVFIGNIISAKNIQNNTDWVTEIEASAIRAANKPIAKTLISLSYAPGTTIAKILKDLGDILGLVVTGSENAEFEMINGYVFAGYSQQALRDLKKILQIHRVGVFIDNAEIVIFNFDGTSSFSTVYLDYNTGLLNVHDITKSEALETGKTKKKKKNKEVVKQRIEFESILNPSIRPNGLIDVKTDHVQGVYLVELYNFWGDNMGGDFNCGGEASV